MAYLFRLILLCVPLLGAVAATAEVQPVDQAVTVSSQALVEMAPSPKKDMVLAMNSVVPILEVSSDAVSVATRELAVASDMVPGAGAGTGLPVCLALVLLVTLIRQRA